jgi:hypothetical protein
MNTNAMNAAEMFKELIRQGLVTPASDYPDLSLPTANRTVMTILSSGTAFSQAPRGSVNAQLDSATQFPEKLKGKPK